MKKAILVLPIILSLTGCDILRTDESVMAEKIQQLGDYIKDRDVDRIYDVFSVETKEAVPSLKDDILDLFDFFKGTIQYVDDLHIYIPIARLPMGHILINVLARKRRKYIRMKRDIILASATLTSMLTIQGPSAFTTCTLMSSSELKSRPSLIMNGRV